MDIFRRFQSESSILRYIRKQATLKVFFISKSIMESCGKKVLLGCKNYRIKKHRISTIEISLSCHDAFFLFKTSYRGKKKPEVQSNYMQNSLKDLSLQEKSLLIHFPSPHSSGLKLFSF